jgi:hypothetical protein
VKIILEVTGTLNVNADGKEVKKLPLKVRGDLDYHELILSSDSDGQSRRHIRHIRYYDTATAAIRVDDHQHHTELRPDQRLVTVDCAGARGDLQAPLGPLTRDELELVQVLGNSALIHQLLPGEIISQGHSWSHSNELLASLLRLDGVHENNATSTFREVQAGVAVVDLTGTVAGAVGGVTSDIDLNAVYNFDLAQKRITWLTMSIEEKRAIGHAEPGFEVKARLRLASKEADTPIQIRSESLAGLTLAPAGGSQLLLFDSVCGFQLLHDRQWQVMVDRHDVAILRFIRQGDLIAQCNASVLPPLKPGEQLKLNSFEADVKRALGDSFGQIEEASQSISDDGIRVLRAVVSGIVADIPIQWTYYHLSDAEGRQAAVVFTLDAKLIEQFAGTDQTLVGSFQFGTPIPVAAEGASEDE